MCSRSWTLWLRARRLFGPSEGGPMAALFAATYPSACQPDPVRDAARWLRAPTTPGRPKRRTGASAQRHIEGLGRRARR